MYIQPVLVSKLSRGLLAHAGNKPSKMLSCVGLAPLAKETATLFLARNSRFATRAQIDSALRQGRGNSRNQGHPSDRFLFGTVFINPFRFS